MKSIEESAVTAMDGSDTSGIIIIDDGYIEDTGDYDHPCLKKA